MKTEQRLQWGGHSQGAPGAAAQWAARRHAQQSFEQLQVVPRSRPRAFGTGRERIGHSQASAGGDVVQQAQEPAHWPLKQVGRV